MKSLFCLLLFPIIVLAQYNSETVTEKSYENSALYFKSHFLNPYGFAGFNKITAGLVNDPFLNSYINPASMPNLDSSTALVYLDFRGDRTESQLVQSYVMPMYDVRSSFAPYPYPDYRLINVARTEAEPVISFGIALNPIKEYLTNFVIGGTYQVIHQSDRYYSMPFGIYTANMYYDAFGRSLEMQNGIQIVDRESGKDEMSNEAHLVTLFSGYEVSDKLNIGISYNGVFHDRTGGYSNINNDTYGNIYTWHYANSNINDKNQSYHHSDGSLGALYKFSKDLVFGLKAGVLSGKSEQKLSSEYNYFNQQNKPEIDTNWYYGNSTSSTYQNWNHDGLVKHVTINFSKIISPTKEITGYYRYQYGNEEISNNSTIFDTSFYSSRWTYTYDNTWYKYRSSSLVKDNRSATGNKLLYDHQALLSFRWELSPFTKVELGISFLNTKTTIETTEPVRVTRISDNESTNKNPSNNYHYTTYLYENKTLIWNYESKEWSFQIPVIIRHNFNSKFGIMIGINRVISSTEITDKTTAIFESRIFNENGVNKEEHNFGERYTSPTRKYSENDINIITGFNLDFSNEFGLHVYLDPESEPYLGIAQWWLGFNLKL